MGFWLLEGSQLVSGLILGFEGVHLVKVWGAEAQRFKAFETGPGAVEVLRLQAVCQCRARGCSKLCCSAV